jgi:hypothetical protein
MGRNAAFHEEIRVSALTPKLSVLPLAQQKLWSELHATPATFALYGGTALALRLGHRTSVDFDFFSTVSFDPDQLAQSVPYLRDAERVQVEPNTLTCRIDRDGPVLVSFFGGLRIGQVAPHDRIQGVSLFVASLLDIAGAKAAVIQKRAEAKDYIDIDALLTHGMDLPTMLAAGSAMYGHTFNPLITIKALSYFADVPVLSNEVRARLVAAVANVNIATLPVLRPLRLSGFRAGGV